MLEIDQQYPTAVRIRWSSVENFNKFVRKIVTCYKLIVLNEIIFNLKFVLLLNLLKGFNIQQLKFTFYTIGFIKYMILSKRYMPYFFIKKLLD